MKAVFKSPLSRDVLEYMVSQLMDLRIAEAALTNAIVNLGKAHPSIPTLKTEMLRARLAADELLAQQLEGVCVACLRGSEPKIRNGKWLHVTGGVTEPYAEEPCTGSDEFRNIISKASDEAIDDLFGGLYATD
jgi:hypothetical protein